MKLLVSFLLFELIFFASNAQNIESDPRKIQIIKLAFTELRNEKKGIDMEMLRREVVVKEFYLDAFNARQQALTLQNIQIVGMSEKERAELKKKMPEVAEMPKPGLTYSQIMKIKADKEKALARKEKKQAETSKKKTIAVEEVKQDLTETTIEVAPVEEEVAIVAFEQEPVAIKTSEMSPEIKEMSKLASEYYQASDKFLGEKLFSSLLANVLDKGDLDEINKYLLVDGYPVSDYLEQAFAEKKDSLEVIKDIKKAAYQMIKTGIDYFHNKQSDNFISPDKQK
jgi:hypothetical protein